MKPRLGFWITLAVAIAYVTYLGAHWLPLGMSTEELSASASRVWDIQQQISQHHLLPWWTPWFMSGSSYGLNYARGFYIIPWIFFSTFTDLMTAGKLTALMAILAGAVTMYFCARHFMKNEWAAVLAALAFMLHPEQIIRAAGHEHITIILFFPFIPLLWLTLSRALESNTFRNTFLCALVAVLAWWTDNKQAFINFLFLFSYALYWLWPRRKQWQPTAWTCGLLAVLGLALGAWVLAPGFVEAGNVKLFAGDPLEGWQKNYAFKSLFALVDRNGAVTSNTTNIVYAHARANGVRSQAEYDQVQRLMSLGSNSPEEYMGLVLLLVIGVTMLWNKRRADRRAFWFFVAALLASVLFSTGLDSVWTANWLTWDALSSQPSQSMSGVALLWLLVIVVFLVFFYRRKLTNTQKIVTAAVALAVFLFIPGFKLLSGLPYFKDIRSPFVFYESPAMFWGAMLIGFFVTDVLVGEKWRVHIPKIVAGLGVLMLLDYWPYQKPMKDNGVPARTLENLQAAYKSFQPDKDWVKTYSLSSRYFHLLGPMWGGKPQVYEAFYNWMCPIGSGVLNQQAIVQSEDRRVMMNRAFLNLMGARYVVFDLDSPGVPEPQMILDNLGRNYTLLSTNEDFIVFRNDTARPYVTAFGRACLYAGDIHKSGSLALALSAKNWPLVQAKEPSVNEVPNATAQKYEKVYGEDSSPFPPLHEAAPVALSDVQLTRENSQLIRVHLTAPSACLAVIAESYYPFWHAEVDGQPVEVLQVNCGLMGLELPAGSHTVILRYQPPRVYAMAGVISVATLLFGISFTIFGGKRSTR
jgi:membrane protein YfhO